MPLSVKPSDPQHTLTIILRRAVRLPVGFVTGFLLPVVTDLWHVTCAICHPVAKGSTRAMTTTLRNLHNKKHWMNRLGSTFWGNAIGLAIGMLSAQLLSNFVEVRGVENLWGLFSQRTLLSESSYRVLSFIAEFLVTLIVFSVVEYLIDMRTHQKTETDSQEEES